MGPSTMPDIILATCRGHPNIQADHDTTLELEEAPILTIRGDCVVCVECRNTRPLRETAAKKALAKLVIAAMNPFIKPYIAYTVIDGFLPGESPRRLVVRKSNYRDDSLMICSSLSASELPADVKKLLRSSYTRCYVLLVSSTLGTDIDTVYELAGCVVKDTGDTNNPG